MSVQCRIPRVIPFLRQWGKIRNVVLFSLHSSLFPLLMYIYTFLSLQLSIFHIYIWQITCLLTFIFNFILLFGISSLLALPCVGQCWRWLFPSPCPRCPWTAPSWAFIPWGQKLLLSRTVGMEIHDPKLFPALNPLLDGINSIFCQNYNSRTQFSLLTGNCDAWILGERCVHIK